MIGHNSAGVPVSMAELLDRMDPALLPALHRIAKTRLRPFFTDPHHMGQLRARVEGTAWPIPKPRRSKRDDR